MSDIISLCTKMDEILLRETFLFGNIGNVYNTREIKKIDLEKIQFSDDVEYKIDDIWRYFNNFRILFKDRQVDILNDQNKYIKLINIYREYVSIVESTYNIKDKFITLEPKEPQDYFKITVYIILTELQMSLRPHKIKRINEMVGVLFSSYLPFIRNHNILVYDPRIPPNNKSWKPEWKFVYENKEILLPNVDLYLDSYFKNYNFQYIYGIKEDIILLKERLEYLEENGKIYLEEMINKQLENVTKNIFEKFPYALVYRDYPGLLEISKHVYRPPLHKLSSIKEGFGWILSIIPIDISAYLLGYPVITCDIPTEKNILESVKILYSKGVEEYLKNIKKNNRTILGCMNFGINVANGVDESGDYEDVVGELVVDYNYDDIFILYDEGVVYYFTVSEFGEIKKKRLNPYNRSRIDNLVKIENNSIFKKKRCEKLKRRGVNITMSGTMAMNLEEIHDGIINGSIRESKPEPKHGHDVHERSFFRAIMERHD